MVRHREVLNMVLKNKRPLLAIQKHRYLLKNKDKAVKTTVKLFMSGVEETSFDLMAKEAQAGFFHRLRNEAFYFWVRDTDTHKDREYAYYKFRPDLPTEQDGKVGQYDLVALREREPWPPTE